MDLGLAGKRALIAAASQGLGAAAARRLSLEGAQVTICSRDAGRAAETAAQINRESGSPVFAIAADVTQPDQVAALVDEAVAKMGGLDILVTNAGGPPAGTFDTTPLEVWAPAFELLVMSAVCLVHAALPHLRKSDAAAILTITSLSVKQPVDNLLLSNAVRPAVVGLTKSLAEELGPEGIRVNSILPGWTATERVEELLQASMEKNGTTREEEIAKRVGNTPLRRVGTTETFGNVAAFLCSPAADYVHGAMVPVDGGAIKATL
jgi:3-oxoacyl-[acyl-carrier protein] reductase